MDKLGGSGEGIQTLEWVELPTQEMIHAIDSRPVAEGAIKRLGLQMKPAELLDSLTVEQLENTERFIVLSYEDTDPVEATRIANTVGEVSSELISERSAARIQLTANVYEKAGVPLAPASPPPLEERAPYAGDGAGALRGARCCQAEPCRKRRGQAWRARRSPRSRPSRDTRCAKRRPKRSRAPQGERGA